MGIPDQLQAERIADQFAESGKIPLVYTRISKLGSKSSKGSIVEYAKSQDYGESVIPQNQLTDAMFTESATIFSNFSSNPFVVGPALTDIDNETETKLEFGDLFNEKDVSLSSEDIIKKNLDQIVIDNNIKENKDC